MIDSTLNDLFSELLDLAIMIDGVPYVPLKETFATMTTVACVVAIVFTIAYLIARFCSEILCAAVLDLRDFLKKRKHSKQLEG